MIVIKPPTDTRNTTQHIAHMIYLKQLAAYNNTHTVAPLTCRHNETDDGGGDHADEDCSAVSHVEVHVGTLAHMSGTTLMAADMMIIMLITMGTTQIGIHPQKLA